MQKTISQKIIEILLERGEISRKYALSKFITSRLGAFVNNLVEDGWKFDSTKSKKEDVVYHGQYIKNKKSLDYVYYLVSAPKKYRN